MKIALIGYGKMGKMIHEIALAKGHSITAIIDSKSCLEQITNAEICIDFSTPYAVLENIRTIAFLKKNIVMGTTGWSQHLPEIASIIQEAGIGFLYSPNFSIGIALFLKILEQTAKIMSQHNQYEVGGIEIHHSKKKDSPSGTAKAIETQINQFHQLTPLLFSSVRIGDVPGTHTVIYDSSIDTITLTHTARNRQGFAEGAVSAAEWLIGKIGIFTLDDLIGSK
jgi:4-hydroxy-tetrahydrodipicolinate reductase